MSLQTRFAILIAVLGLTVLLVVIAASASLEFMLREVRRPLTGMQRILADLGDAKAHTERLGALVRAEPGTSEFGVRDPGHDASIPAASVSPEQIRAELAGIEGALRAVRAQPDHERIAGKSTLANIEKRAAAVRSLLIPPENAPLDMTSTPGNEPSQLTTNPREEPLLELVRLHNLIERAERMIVTSTSEALEYAADIRSRLMTVLGFALLVTALTGLLGLILVRRWVLRPVENLRVAAARIAQGDFDYRVPIPGAVRSDELSLLSHEVNHMSAMVKALQDERVERERVAALGEMVRRLVHNLRNPLAGIRGLAEVSRTDLTAANDGSLPQRYRDDLIENQERIISSVDRFESWLSDLLKATRPAQIAPLTIQPRPWLEGVAEVYRASAEAKGIELAVDAAQSPAEATVDASHLEHAVGAIIANAIEATAASPPPDPVRPRVCVRSALDHGHWLIEVSDTGPGIPPEIRERIFAPYFTTKAGGSGIGLATSLQVVRAHGGRILVKDTSETQENACAGGQKAPGALFQIFLPLYARVAKDHQVARIGQQGATGGQDPHHRR